ncbi:MAG: N-acetylmuramoyl-L-alanine amidase [Acidobacteriaceae bacterium]|jgi:N-acetylmuramoyl-L-alanine amidase
MCCGAAAVRADTTPVIRTQAGHAAKKPIALSPWEQAERGRDALEAILEGDRTRADYSRAMDAYRAIYHANPADIHAPAAVNAVAELLAEQGRGQHDRKSLQSAVGQYEFLRTQYPGSSLRVQALLAEGQIEENDLGDAATAKEKYKLLLKDYPRSEQADEAKAGLASLEQLSGNREQGTGKTAVRGAGPAAGRTVTAQANGGEISRSLVSGSAQRSAGSAQRPAASEGSSLPAMAQTSGARISIASTTPSATDTSAPAASMERVATANVDASGLKRSGKRALVTGIRHWSTATYTRVAIDLGDNVTYEAARVPNPDRIYFDLHGTRLASELVGKSFAVTDDGFLKRVRAAQYTDDVTRVVLDVNDVTEYSAFLLPNPYRLIIDIHGGKGTATREQGTGNSEPMAVDVPAPHVAATVKPTAERPVPNAVATRSANTTSEVADLSELPGRVEATSKPTSKPISAVVDSDASSDNPRSATGDQPAAADGTQTPSGVPETSAAAPAAAIKKTRRTKTKADTSTPAVADATPARAAAPMADGETSLVRALGLKIGRIVIDAGHGGHDSGTIGADGIEEKDVVLDVALRLGKLLSERLGAEVIYTRSDDTFIPLETRTAIANKAQADLFLSIHANSSPDASARGVETYYLNFTSDPTALDVAARENAVSDQSIHQLSDLVKKIALKDKIAESREFASDVEGSLYSGLAKGNAGLKDRGVKKAPFVVLIGANMPSILAEISFVTNPKDASQLAQPEYRQRVAESLYKGVARYEGGLSGTKPPTERAAVGQ